MAAGTSWSSRRARPTRRVSRGTEFKRGDIEPGAQRNLQLAGSCAHPTLGTCRRRHTVLIDGDPGRKPARGRRLATEVGLLQHVTPFKAPTRTRRAVRRATARSAATRSPAVARGGASWQPRARPVPNKAGRSTMLRTPGGPHLDRMIETHPVRLRTSVLVPRRVPVLSPTVR
jgi:hypothetical protein